MTLAKATGGLDAQLRTLAIAAWLHDIGKLAIPDGILLKPGPLDHQERAIMQTHVTIGYELVKGKPFLAEAAEIIFAHHERCDGTGYPRGLSAEEIPVGAKIFSIVDALDAITSDRPYRSAASFQTAKISIAREIGTQFDSRVAQAFLQISSDVWERLRAESASFDILPLMVGTAGSSVGQFATP
jgi:HD-GYP domain-containing protein (c-di-GMP phosphodiesterase class II)